MYYPSHFVLNKTHVSMQSKLKARHLVGEVSTASKKTAGCKQRAPAGAAGGVGVGGVRDGVEGEAVRLQRCKVLGVRVRVRVRVTITGSVLNLITPIIHQY